MLFVKKGKMVKIFFYISSVLALFYIHPLLSSFLGAKNENKDAVFTLKTIDKDKKG